MSYGGRIRGNPQSVQKLLDENAQLIQAIVDYQNKGKAADCIQYQQLLHKNLMYLASLADSSQNIQAMMPPPPTTSQVPSATPVSAAIGVPSVNVPGNVQDRKLLGATPVDQGSTGVPNMASQVISPAGSQMSSGMHSVPVSVSMGSSDGTGNTPYAGNVSINQLPLDANTSSSTGYPGNVNQVMASNMGQTSQSVMPGQHQTYVPNMHTTRMQQHSQGQQFMMQQGVAMGYNRPPIQVHPQQGHQSQQMNQQQPYMGNQTVTGQSTTSMMPYQQAASSYDSYNPMQHMNTGYSNPYGTQ